MVNAAYRSGMKNIRHQPPQPSSCAWGRIRHSAACGANGPKSAWSDSCQKRTWPPGLHKNYHSPRRMLSGRAPGIAFMQRAVSIPSHFPFRVRLAHCLLTGIDCVPEGSWTYWLNVNSADNSKNVNSAPAQQQSVFANASVHPRAGVITNHPENALVLTLDNIASGR